jgi:hypothetical protein
MTTAAQSAVQVLEITTRGRLTKGERRIVPSDFAGRLFGQDEQEALATRSPQDPELATGAPVPV